VNESKSILARFVGFLGSFTLACIIFLFLFVLTFFGTLEQQHASLHDVRTKYFDSLFFFPEAVPIPLPGANLLLAILFVNLLVGGMIRMRRTWSRLGIFVIHIGIAVLLLSSLVEGIFSKKGLMTVWEGSTKDAFESPVDWDVSVIEQLPEGRQRTYTIPSESLPAPGKTARFRAEGLPFEIALSGYLRNCEPRTVPKGSDATEGFALRELPPAMEAEQNFPGITATLIGSDLRREALLWSLPDQPLYATTIGGRNFAVELHRRRWPLPFSVTLRKFTHDVYPGTSMASSFSSDVTRIENNVATDVHISMNEPMRHGGYIVYQSGFGPQPAVPGSPMYSTFSVVENPADRGPWIAVTIIFLGLAGHMIFKLLRHIDAESRRRA